MIIKKLFIYILFFLSIEFLVADQLINEVKQFSINKEYANKFSQLIVQSKDGRMKPLDTLNIDILNKISSKRTFYNLNHNQVVLGMIFNSNIWKQVPMYKINNSKIKKILNTNENRVSYNFLFSNLGEYKLERYTNPILNLEAKEQNAFQKELLKINELIAISNFIYNEGFLKIYPLKNIENNRWFSPYTLKENFKNEAKYEAQILYVSNKKAVQSAFIDNNWKDALLIVDKISNHQKKYAKELLPSPTLIKAELFYNKILLFEKLYVLYILIGLVYLFISFLSFFKNRDFLMKSQKILNFVIITLFVFHSINLCLRWYISFHAPWSNAYESMILVSWAILFAGLYFSKKTSFAISSTTFCAGILLFSAHLSFIDPQITNLSPNLQSFWLTFHVAVVSISYGFLALCALLGLIIMIFYTFINKDNFKHFNKKINELVKINELSMILGLVLLIIGTILGSVWANESWGRIWGWDPKESWSLISIFVYMVILHIRLFKNKNNFLFSTFSILSYGTILMTYFGVNYFFDAMHVYASNTNADIPLPFYFILLGICILILIAYKNMSKVNKKEFSNE